MAVGRVTALPFKLVHEEIFLPKRGIRSADSLRQPNLATNPALWQRSKRMGASRRWAQTYVQPFGRLFNLARFGSEAGQATMWSSRSPAAI